MTVHIGQVTSEVHSAAPVVPDAPAQQETPAWEERMRVAALVERVARDRARTATGGIDD
ncbi:hypothetical protein GCM10022237_08210 [Nocardioides ginsengisoli]|uniref:Uncharacterized protein n=1 Tax=Nocardioides ginsengisoli TaxID=363868 RepID=A0ABW3W2B6_9ACTN